MLSGASSTAIATGALRSKNGLRMTRRTGTSLAMVSAFALLCVGGLGYLAVSMGLELPGVRQGWRLEASFAGVEGLVFQSDVDVAGVRVGRVTRVVTDPRGGALVSMVIDPGAMFRAVTALLLSLRGPTEPGMMARKRPVASRLVRTFRE